MRIHEDYTQEARVRRSSRLPLRGTNSGGFRDLTIQRGSGISRTRILSLFELKMDYCTFYNTKAVLRLREFVIVLLHVPTEPYCPFILQPCPSMNSACSPSIEVAFAAGCPFQISKQLMDRVADKQTSKPA